jgi:hypothetical protein
MRPISVHFVDFRTSQQGLPPAKYYSVPISRYRAIERQRFETSGFVVSLADG